MNCASKILFLLNIIFYLFGLYSLIVTFSLIKTVQFFSCIFYLLKFLSANILTEINLAKDKQAFQSTSKAYTTTPSKGCSRDVSFNCVNISKIILEY